MPIIFGEFLDYGHNCESCGSSKNKDDPKKQLSKCSKCKLSYYCSKNCQVSSWSSHKIICKQRLQDSVESTQQCSPDLSNPADLCFHNISTANNEEDLSKALSSLLKFILSSTKDELIRFKNLNGVLMLLNLTTAYSNNSKIIISLYESISAIIVTAKALDNYLFESIVLSLIEKECLVFISKTLQKHSSNRVVVSMVANAAANIATVNHAIKFFRKKETNIISIFINSLKSNKNDATIINTILQCLSNLANDIHMTKLFCCEFQLSDIILEIIQIHESNINISKYSWAFFSNMLRDLTKNEPHILKIRKNSKLLNLLKQSIQKSQDIIHLQTCISVLVHLDNFQKWSVSEGICELILKSIEFSLSKSSYASGLVDCIKAMNDSMENDSYRSYYNKINGLELIDSILKSSSKNVSRFEIFNSTISVIQRLCYGPTSTENCEKFISFETHKIILEMMVFNKTNRDFIIKSFQVLINIFQFDSSRIQSKEVYTLIVSDILDSFPNDAQVISAGFYLISAIITDSVSAKMLLYSLGACETFLKFLDNFGENDDNITSLVYAIYLMCDETTILLKFNSMGLLIKIISKFYDIDKSPYYSEKTKSVVGGIYSYFNNIHVPAT